MPRPDPQAQTTPPDESLGLDHAPGGNHYRAYVGPPQDYDLVAAMTFGLLTVLGLRQQHRVLDVGCGSLRVGRLLLPYLNRGGYTGLEPNRWLVADGIAREVGQDQIDIKQPRFVHEEDGSSLIAEGTRFDFVLAQSILSHCGPDLMDRWIDQSARLLAEDGALVATFVEGESDNEREGWIYPECVAYSRASVERIAARHGLETVVLDWRHPRQQWVLMARPAFGAQGFANGPLAWSSAFERFNARSAG